MGILFRSAIVIGTIVYLAPFRYSSQEAAPAAEHSSRNTSLSGAVDSVWKAIPDSAKKTVSDEVRKQLFDTVRREALSGGGTEVLRATGPSLKSAGNPVGRPSHEK